MASSGKCSTTIWLLFTIAASCLIKCVNGVRYPTVQDFYSEYRSISTRNASERCQNQLDEYLAGLRNGTDWALNMLDATGKIGAGIMRGNEDDYGFYDQCLSINAEIEGDVVLGKYCYYGLIVPYVLLLENISSYLSNEYYNLKMPQITIHDQPRLRKKPELQGRNQVEPEPTEIFGIALCIPDACVPTDMVGEFGVDSYCQMKDEFRELDGSDIACIVFLAVIVCFMILSTAYDLYIHRNNKKPIHPITVAFSAYSNGKKILATSKKGNPDQILCFQGMKSISLFWVVAGHTMSAKQEIGTLNINDIYNWMRHWFSIYILQAPLAVDTFLFLSGVLLSYNFLKSMSKPKARFNIILFYVHRYLRLTPAVAALYFVATTVLRRVGDGPLWYQAFAQTRDSCLDHWWAFFLYIQNYVAVDDMCIVPTWYLSVDMQFFILSPLLLLPLVRFRKFTLQIWLPLAIFLAILSPFLVVYLYDVHFWLDDYYNYYYYVTHTRFGPWLVGIAMGIYLLKVRDKKFNFSIYVCLAGWLACFGVMAAIMFTQDHLVYNFNALNNAFYLALSKPAWALCLSWMVFACIKGYGGFINTFLSLPIFQVIAKLSYSMYLVHFLYILMVIGHQRIKVFFHDFENLNIIVSNIMFTMLIGTFWTLAFESPMITIEKIIFGGGGPRKPRQVKKLDDVPDEVKVEEVNGGEGKREDVKVGEINGSDTNTKL